MAIHAMGFVTIPAQDSCICPKLEETEVTLARKAALGAPDPSAPTGPAHGDFMRNEAATPDKPAFQGEWTLLSRSLLACASYWQKSGKLPRLWPRTCFESEHQQGGSELPPDLKPVFLVSRSPGDCRVSLLVLLSGVPLWPPFWLRTMCLRTPVGVDQFSLKSIIYQHFKK